MGKYTQLTQEQRYQSYVFIKANFWDYLDVLVIKSLNRDPANLQKSIENVCFD